MPKNLRPETLIFLECLAEAIGETAATLARPTRANLTRSYDNEPLDRKLRRLAARGVITLPEPTDPRVVRLTEVGFTLARGEFAPEQRWARQWDGHWRMVLFDIAEHDRPVRTRLRAALRHAKLGYLQGSVWISPDPLEQLRSSIRSITANPESLLFFDGRPSAGETDAAIVAGAWDFARLDEAHRECLGILGHPGASSG
jgi:phenylacetic acid degradation operon negative regulatory protein